MTGDAARPTVTAKAIAKRLGVGTELINGLVAGNRVAGFRTDTGKGNAIWLVYKDEWPRLCALIGKPPTPF